MDMRYRIGEFAKLGGVTVKTLRFYDRIGLLKPACVDARTRYRFYVPEQLEELASILALKNLGASLDQLRGVVGGAAFRQRGRALLEHLWNNAERSLQAAQHSLNEIGAELDELNRPDSGCPIVVRRRPAIRVASIRAKVGCYAQIAAYERDLQEAITADATGALQGVLWHRCADSGALEGEPFVELKRRVPMRGAYELKELPPVTVASAYSKSDDTAAEHVYDAIRRWMHVRGYRLAGPKREIYLGRMLEIQFPLQSL